MDLSQQYLDYFNRGRYEDERYWERIGHKPNFDGCHVLDIGCGLGSLAIYIASCGANRVVGLDVNASSIRFARENSRQNFPHLLERVEFVDQALADYPEEQFDIIVSKNAFEHIVEFESNVLEMKKRLKPGGRIYAGFGPLYRSPHGFHGAGTDGLVSFPWEHLIVGEKVLVQRWNRRNKRPIESVREAGLNLLKPEEYLHIFQSAGFTIVSLRYNQARDETLFARAISSSFSLLRRVPPLRNYFTFNIFCILEKPI